MPQDAAQGAQSSGNRDVNPARSSDGIAIAILYVTIATSNDAPTVVPFMPNAT